jgi:hypothetical protein
MGSEISIVHHHLQRVPPSDALKNHVELVPSASARDNTHLSESFQSKHFYHRGTVNVARTLDTSCRAEVFRRVQSSNQASAGNAASSGDRKHPLNRKK